MGDRVDCILRLAGILDNCYIDSLTSELQGADANLPSDYETHGQALCDGEALFDFEQMNYGEMPAGISQILRDAKLAYFWEWKSGFEFSSGIEIYDPFKGKSKKLSTLGGEIVISITAAQDPEKVAEIKAWGDLCDMLGFEVFTSNHHLLRLLAGECSVDPRFFEIHLHDNPPA